MSNEDQRGIIGIWEALYVERNGRRSPSPMQYEVFEEDVWWWSRPGDIESTKFPYRVDITKVPHHLDILDHDGGTGVYRGIYKIEGNTLTICFPEDESAARPEEFLSSFREHWEIIVLTRAERIPEQRTRALPEQ